MTPPGPRLLAASELIRGNPLHDRYGLAKVSNCGLVRETAKASRRLSPASRRLRPSASQRTPVDEATARVHSTSWMAAVAALSKPVKVGYAIHGRELSSVAHYEHEPHAATAAPQSSRFVPWILLWN